MEKRQRVRGGRKVSHAKKNAERKVIATVEEVSTMLLAPLDANRRCERDEAQRRRRILKADIEIKRQFHVEELVRSLYPSQPLPWEADCDVVQIMASREDMDLG